MEMGATLTQAAYGADKLVAVGDQARADCDPERITSPARKGRPSLPRVFASHTTAFTGEPWTAAPTPVENSSPFFCSTIPASVRSSLRGSPLASPRMNTPHDALSATVS